MDLKAESPVFWPQTNSEKQILTHTNGACRNFMLLISFWVLIEPKRGSLSIVQSAFLIINKECPHVFGVERVKELKSCKENQRWKKVDLTKNGVL